MACCPRLAPSWMTMRAWRRALLLPGLSLPQQLRFQTAQFQDARLPLPSDLVLLGTWMEQMTSCKRRWPHLRGKQVLQGPCLIQGDNHVYASMDLASLHRQ